MSLVPLVLPLRYGLSANFYASSNCHLMVCSVLAGQQRILMLPIKQNTYS